MKPAAAGLKAARLLLMEVHNSISKKESFALESTLSGKTYIRLLQQAKQAGFEIELHYLWLSSATHAVARVRTCVKAGGHHVPISDIRRRFTRSLAHLVADYLPLADRWIIWDGRGLPVNRLAISAIDDIESVRKLIGI